MFELRPMFAEKLTPPKAEYFCSILADVRSAKLPGWWQGSAYRSHPCGVIRNGIIFANHWSTYNYCHAEVILDPTSGIKPGQNYSASPGDPFPHPISGGSLQVYWSGSWSADDGPWRAIIISTLAELEIEIAAWKAEKEEKALAEARKRAQDHEEVLALARAALRMKP